MARSEFVRARVSPRAKERLVQVAHQSQTTVSHVIRALIGRVSLGHVDDRSIRQDMAAVRQMANAVLSVAEGTRGDPSDAVALADIGRRLRDVAARHLGPVA